MKNITSNDISLSASLIVYGGAASLQKVIDVELTLCSISFNKPHSKPEATFHNQINDIVTTWSTKEKL